MADNAADSSDDDSEDDVDAEEEATARLAYAFSVDIHAQGFLNQLKCDIARAHGEDFCLFDGTSALAAISGVVRSSNGDDTTGCLGPNGDDITGCSGPNGDDTTGCSGPNGGTGIHTGAGAGAGASSSSPMSEVCGIRV